MKKFICLLVLITTLGFSQSKQVLEVEIPKVSSFNDLVVVTLNGEYYASGCADERKTMSVLRHKTSNYYIAGETLKVPNVINPNSCRGIVTKAYFAQFPVYGNPGKIYLEVPIIPHGFIVDVEVKNIPSF